MVVLLKEKVSWISAKSESIVTTPVAAKWRTVAGCYYI